MNARGTHYVGVGSKHRREAGVIRCEEGLDRQPNGLAERCSGLIGGRCGAYHIASNSRSSVETGITKHILISHTFFQYPSTHNASA